MEFDDITTVVGSIDKPVILLGQSYGAFCSVETALRTDDLRSPIVYEPPVPVGEHYPNTADGLDEMNTLCEAGKHQQARPLFFREIARIPLALLRTDGVS